MLGKTRSTVGETTRITTSWFLQSHPVSLSRCLALVAVRTGLGDRSHVWRRRQRLLALDLYGHLCRIHSRLEASFEHVSFALGETLGYLGEAMLLDEPKHKGQVKDHDKAVTIGNKR